jgi:hypothetical protein
LILKKKNLLPKTSSYNNNIALRISSLKKISKQEMKAKILDSSGFGNNMNFFYCIQFNYKALQQNNTMQFQTNL